MMPSDAYVGRLLMRGTAVLGELHPDLRSRVLRVLEAMEGRVVPYEGTRTFAEQRDLYAQGRSRRGRIVTWAEPGESPHNWGAPYGEGALACDLVLHPVEVQVRAHPSDPRFPDLWDDRSAGAVRAWRDLGAAARAEGLVWGGSWPVKRDLPHVELVAWEQYRPDNWRALVEEALRGETHA